MTLKTAGINWEQVRTRLRSSMNALDQSITPPARRVEAVYRERAEQLARPAETARTAESTSPSLAFLLGGQRYSLDVNSLCEVALLPRWTPVPGGPAELLGVIPHRGEVKSVLDLGRMLGTSTSAPGEQGYFLSVKDGGREALIRVDALVQIVRIKMKELATPSAEGPASRFLKGVAADGTGVLCERALVDYATALAGPSGTQSQ